MNEPATLSRDATLERPALPRGVGRAGLIAAGVVFVSLTVLAGTGATEQIDLHITRALQTRPAGWLDIAASILGLLGSFEVTALLTLALATFLWRTGARRPALLLAVAFVILTVAELAMKSWLPHPGPPRAFSRPVWASWASAPSGKALHAGSYPSGNAMRSTLLLTACLYLVRRQLAIWLLIVTMVVMAVSRVYQGVHWASDVAGACLLAVMAAVLVFHGAVVPARSRTMEDERAPRGGC